MFLYGTRLKSSCCRLKQMFWRSSTGNYHPHSAEFSADGSFKLLRRTVGSQDKGKEASHEFLCNYEYLSSRYQVIRIPCCDRRIDKGAWTRLIHVSPDLGIGVIGQGERRWPFHNSRASQQNYGCSRFSRGSGSCALPPREGVSDRPNYATPTSKTRVGYSIISEGSCMSRPFQTTHPDIAFRFRCKPFTDIH